MLKKGRYLIMGIFACLTIICAFCISLVVVNYDSSKYLPDDAKINEAMDINISEFGDNGSLLVMIEECDNSKINSISNYLNELGVDFSYQSNGSNILFSVVLKENDYSESSQTIVKEFREWLNEESYSFYMSGKSYLTFMYNLMIKEEMPRIIIILLPIILIILFLMTSSFIEPFLFMIVVGVSVVLNMGSNAMLNSVSYMTYSISAVLQFALCMDYSIMLLHRYKDIRKETDDKYDAMKKALKSSLLPILASSLTTIAGFVAIMFMKYKIGFDIGFVLAKGVLFTLITVLLLMPVLIVLCDKLIYKTKHRNLVELCSREKLTLGMNRNLYKCRFVIVIFALALFITAFAIQNKNNFVYSDSASVEGMEEISLSKEKISDNFGANNNIIILVSNSYNTNDLLLKIEDIRVEDVNYLVSAISYDKILSAEELQSLIDLDDEKVFTLLTSILGNDINMEKLVEYISKFENIDSLYSISEMNTYLNSIVPINIDVSFLGVVYNMMGVEKTSVKALFTFIKTPYTLSQMNANINNYISSNELAIIYNYFSLDKMDIITLLKNYITLMDLDMNSSSMYQALGGVVDSDSINSIYQMLGVNELSINALLEFLLNEYNATIMKNIVSTLVSVDLVDYIDPIYMQLEANGTLNDGKTSIKIVLATLVNYLTDENYKSSINDKIALFESLESKKSSISFLNSNSSLILSMDSFDISLLSSLDDINVEAIKNNFVGKNYQRIILNLNLSEESDETFAYIDELKKILGESGIEYYLLGESVGVKEIKDISRSDYLLVTIISVVLILIIVGISFSSIIIPIVLVLVIEGSIFINMSIPVFTGESIIYIGYIIVGCIQLGATIDYGILVTNRYLVQDSSLSRVEKMRNAIGESINSILTSGLILTIAGLTLAVGFNIPALSSMGRLIGFGGLISMLIVIFVLPLILVILDRFKILSPIRVRKNK